MTLNLSKENLPKLRKLQQRHYKMGLEYDNDWNEGSDAREAVRLKKVISFLELEDDLDIEYDNAGLISINKKFIVSLRTNKWKVRGKNVWYRHQNDLQSFVDKYILKKQKENSK
jgi:hypothetical protein